MWIEDLLATFRSKRWVWQAGRAQAVPVAAAITGALSKVVGVIADDEPLVSPFARTPCVMWMARLEAKTDVIRSGGVAYTLDEPRFCEAFVQIQRAPFWIEADGGGRLLVENTSTTAHLALENMNEHPHVNDENAAFVAFMRSAGIPTTQHMGIAGDHRFWETTLRRGDRVSVYGTIARASVIVAGAYRGLTEMQTSLRGEDGRPLVVARARPLPGQIERR